MTFYWVVIRRRKGITEDFIESNADQFSWVDLCNEKKFSEDFLRRNSERLPWSIVSVTQKLSHSFLTDYSDKVNWVFVSRYQRISMSFIKSNLNFLKLSSVLICQELSSDEILEITQTAEFLSQLKEGTKKQDPEWLQFKQFYYTDKMIKDIKDEKIRVFF